jgi:hypothetical protein
MSGKFVRGVAAWAVAEIAPIARSEAIPATALFRSGLTTVI